MQINYQSVNFKADQKLLDFISAKLEKLNTFEHRILDITVYLKLDNTDEKENKIVETLIKIKDKKLFQTNKARTFEAATDIIVDSLKEQLKRLKDKRISASQGT